MEGFHKPIMTIQCVPHDWLMKASIQYVPHDRLMEAPIQCVPHDWLMETFHLVCPS